MSVSDDRSDSTGQASNPDTARNLLFGILALQNNFIDRTALLSAFNVWTDEKTRPLGRILVGEGKLDASRHELLNVLVADYLKIRRGRIVKSPRHGVGYA